MGQNFGAMTKMSGFFTKRSFHVGFFAFYSKYGKPFEVFLFFQQQLRLSIKSKREDIMRQIKAHARDSKKVEGNIFETGKKLRALLEENHRFNVVSCTKMVQSP